MLYHYVPCLLGYQEMLFSIMQCLMMNSENEVEEDLCVYWCVDLEILLLD